MAIQRPRSYYVKVALFFFGIGATLEFLMVLSGFYKQDLTSEEDLEKALKKKDKRRVFLEALRQQAKEKYEQNKGVKIEDVTAKETKKL